jgi:hypothetical protein
MLRFDRVERSTKPAACFWCKQEDREREAIFISGCSKHGGGPCPDDGHGGEDIPAIPKPACMEHLDRWPLTMLHKMIPSILAMAATAIQEAENERQTTDEAVEGVCKVLILRAGGEVEINCKEVEAILKQRIQAIETGDPHTIKLKVSPYPMPAKGSEQVQ